MEQTVMEPQQAPPPADSGQRAQKLPEQLFKFSTWVHVGPGAENCEAVDEAAGTVSCQDPLHFHAWCRMPNQFQHRDIREKALGARARRARQLRDPESDLHAVLEDDLDAITRGPDARGALLDELLAKDWWRDQLEAIKDVAEIEDEATGEKVYATLDDDRVRLQQLESMDSDERPQEEFLELGRHIERWGEAIEKRRQEIVAPKREALDAQDDAELVRLVREQRIDDESQAEFMHIYSTWEWYIGTLRHPGGKRRFDSIEHMQESAPEVIEALDAVYQDLERTLNETPGKAS